MANVVNPREGVQDWLGHELAEMGRVEPAEPEVTAEDVLGRDVPDDLSGLLPDVDEGEGDGILARVAKAAPTVMFMGFAAFWAAVLAYGWVLAVMRGDWWAVAHWGALMFWPVVVFWLTRGRD